MSETTEREPTAEEQRAIEQLREADPAIVILQAYEILASGAVVKLGRADARALIDALDGLTKAAEGRLPPQLVARMRQDVTQLQIAQVQAEREAGGQAPGQAAPEGAGPAAAASQGQGQPPQGQGQPPQGQKMTDRLWIPGRDPGPPRH